MALVWESVFAQTRMRENFKLVIYLINLVNRAIG